MCILLCYILVPAPIVTLTAPDNQTVGDPLTLTCNVIAVRGITSSVDIVWRRDGTEVMRTNDTSSTMMDTSLVYTDTYSISQLNTTDEGIEYECQVVINSTPQVMAIDTVSLDVTGKYTFMHVCTYVPTYTTHTHTTHTYIHTCIHIIIIHTCIHNTHIHTCTHA